MMKKKNIIFLLPSLLGFLIFYIVPFFSIFYYACIDNVFSREFAGLRNFHEVMRNRYFLLAMKNTGLFLLIGIPLIMFFSVATALFLARRAKTSAGKGAFLQSFFFLPVVLPSVILALFWDSVFPALAKLSPFLSLLVLYVWKYAGLNIMLILTALTAVDREILDAAAIDGAGYIRRTVFVTLPCISPVLFFTLILSVVSAFRIYRESYLLYGNYPDDSVYLLQNYLNNHFLKLDYQNIAAAALLFASVIYIIVLFWFKSEQKRGLYL